MQTRGAMAAVAMVAAAALPTAPAPATPVPAVPVPASPAGDGTGADVVVEGATIVITVPMTVLVRGNLLDSSIQQALADDLQAAADYWNEGLAQHTYFECFTLEVAVAPTFVHPVNRDYDAPGHVVLTYGWSHVGAMADGRQLPSVLDHHGPDDPTLDYEGPFDRRVEAYWPPWLFEDTRNLAHELGHLFGMGDDYARDAEGDVAPLEGREGTLMDSGDAIDSVLAQRVGDQVIGAGYGDDLPQCWKGRATLATSTVYPDADATTCRDAWTLDLVFIVEATGTVDGTATATVATPATCPFPIGGTAQWDTVHFDVSGTRTAGGLSLRFHLTSYEPPGGASFAGLIAVFTSAQGADGGAPVSLAVAGGAVAGPVEWSIQSGNPPATYSSSGTLEAQCVVSCEEG